MPKILSGNRSNILVNGKPIEGLQEIAFRTVKPYTEIPAIGTDERVGVVYGTTRVTGTLRVRSVSDVLEEALKLKTPFQILASVQGDGGQSAHEITLDECFLHGKSFAIAAGGAGETTYEFSATRER